MSFELPQALLLALPLALLLWRTARLPGPPMWLRIGVVGALVLALARPEIVRGTEGADLLVVVDRSRSMPGGSEARAKELIELASREARPGDRLGVIAFGRDAWERLAPQEVPADFIAFHPVLGKQDRTAPDTQGDLFVWLHGARHDLNLACAMAIARGAIPPTVGLLDPETEYGLDFVPWKGREARVSTCLNLAAGFGGFNVCVVLGRFE